MLPWIKKLITLKRTVATALFLLVAVFLLLGFQTALAQDTAQELFGLEPVEQTLLLPTTDIRLIVARIIRAVLGLLGLIALSLVLYAGYTIMTSGGNEEKIAQGKKILINAVIGLIIILSAIAIVQFVLNMLGYRDAVRPGQTGKVTIQSFAGSGALGRVVKDHYPFINQTGVPRNTAIVVTFFEPIDPSTIIENTNNTCWGDDGLPKTDCSDDELANAPYYGDCVDLNGSGSIDDRETECDTLKTSAVGIFVSTSTEANYYSENFLSQLVTGGVNLVPASAYTLYEDGARRNAYTFVFKPLEFIGNDREDVWYTVRLTNEIKKKEIAPGDDGRVFNPQRHRFYTWDFQTNTEIDFSPPYVVDVYPSVREDGYRNSVVQITFNEAMDPTTVAGMIESETGFNNVLLNTNFSGVPTSTVGSWKISNGYRTIEFIPGGEPCGLNSCGKEMYCLPLDCPPEDQSCTSIYAGLVRTAKLTNNPEIPFEGELFSGAMDISSNALDGNRDNNPDDQPEGLGEPLIIEIPEKDPDNYFWNFNVKNEIDKEAPHIQQVEPNLDASAIRGDMPLKLYFSSRMIVSSLYGLQGIFIREHPEDRVDDDIWFAPFFENTLGEDNVTRTNADVKHRVFGPNLLDLYYFVSVGSEAVSKTQNCLYPGRGPNVPGPVTQDSGTASESCLAEYDEEGNYVSSDDDNCVPVTNAELTDTGCVQLSDPGADNINMATSTVTKCIDYLMTEDISPTTVFSES